MSKPRQNSWALGPPPAPKIPAAPGLGLVGHGAFSEGASLGEGQRARSRKISSKGPRTGNRRWRRGGGRKSTPSFRSATTPLPHTCPWDRHLPTHLAARRAQPSLAISLSLVGSLNIFFLCNRREQGKGMGGSPSHRVNFSEMFLLDCPFWGEGLRLVKTCP